MVYYYPHPELFEEFEKPNFEEYSGNIILWGAGRIGGIAVHCLESKNVEICAFCDSSEEKWGTEYCGYKVISPEEMKCEYPDAAVLITNVYYGEVVSILENMGYHDVFDCASLFAEIDFSNYSYWMLPEYAIRNVELYMQSTYRQKKGARGIDHIYLTVTTKCTLRCKECCAFVPYIENPCLYDADDVMDDFFRVLQCLGHINVVYFYGGEPLLHPRLGYMVSRLKKEKRIDKISIITNGTIIPNAELIEALKNDERCVVRISDYGELSTKKKQVVQRLQENGILYEITNYEYWEKNSRIGKCDDSEQMLEKKFLRCRINNQLVLLNHKIYICSVASALNNIGVLPENEDNYVDLQKYGNSQEKLMNRLFRYTERQGIKKYMDACRYCSGSYCTNYTDKVPVAEQTKKLMTLPKLF